MSDVLTVAWNTTNKLSSIDRKHFFGGKLANASTIFLNMTSNAVASILNTKFIGLNSMITKKTKIATTILHISSDFVNKTSDLLSKMLMLSPPSLSPAQDSIETNRLLSTTINLASVTGQSLGHVINATSELLTKSVDDQTSFVTKLLNSTAHLMDMTTDSLGNLLDTTNSLVLGIVQSKANVSSNILNETANLLNASSSSVSSILNLTTLLINNAATKRLTRDGNNFTLAALNVANDALKLVFNKTSDLLHGVAAAEKDITLRLINGTGIFLSTAFQIKATIVNATLDMANYIADSSGNLVASKLSSIANKITSHFDGSHRIEINYGSGVFLTSTEATNLLNDTEIETTTNEAQNINTPNIDQTTQIDSELGSLEQSRKTKNN